MSSTRRILYRLREKYSNWNNCKLRNCSGNIFHMKYFAAAFLTQKKEKQKNMRKKRRNAIDSSSRCEALAFITTPALNDDDVCTCMRNNHFNDMPAAFFHYSKLQRFSTGRLRMAAKVCSRYRTNKSHTKVNIINFGRSLECLHGKKTENFVGFSCFNDCLVCGKPRASFGSGFCGLTWKRD